MIGRFLIMALSSAPSISHADEPFKGSVEVVRECVAASQVFDRLSELPAVAGSVTSKNAIWTEAISGVHHIDVMKIVAGPNAKGILNANGGILETLLVDALACYSEGLCEGNWSNVSKSTSSGLKAACALDYMGMN